MSGVVDTGARDKAQTGREYRPTLPRKLPDAIRRDGPKGRENQPISQIRWVAPAEIRANGYNPNRQFVNEAQLLKVSLLESGWCAPLLVHPGDDGMLELTDGFHRWWLAANDQEVAALGDGLVPVAPDPSKDALTSRMTTIRMNRARGVHAVVGMADTVAEIAALGADEKEIAARLGMEPEEVMRLLDRGVMTQRGSHPDGRLGQAWAPDREAEALAAEQRAALDEAEGKRAAARKVEEREARTQ